MAQSKEILIKILLSLLSSFLLSLWLTRWMIKKEQKKHISQVIKDDIVKSHQKKSNTPTMGGIAIFLSTWFIFFIFGHSYLQDKKVISLLLTSVYFFILGFIDDALKIKFHNGKGLAAWIRFFSEVAFSIVLLLFLDYEQKSRWILNIFSFSSLNLGLFFVPFIIFMIVGTANAVNLTDGLDGLASGLMLMAISPFLLLSLIQKEWGIAFFLVSIIGSGLGFLFYNFHPAKIFMGDVGSLPLGAVLAVTSFLLHSELILLVSGALFLIEALSVIIQVTSFKLTHKRVFKMSPLHHHLEMKGYEEWKIVMIFYVIGFLLAILSLILEVIL